MRSFALCVVVFFVAALNAAVGNTVFPSFSSDTDGINLTFALPECNIEQVEIGNVTYQRMSYPEAGTTREVGFPELLTFSTMLAVPAGMDVSAELISSEQEVWADMLPYPAQAMDSESQARALDIRSDYYSGNADWQLAPVIVSQPATLRDFRVVTLTVQPFAYNPTTRELNVQTQMQVRVNFTPGRSDNFHPPARLSRSFEPLYRAMILNYDELTRDEEPDYQSRCILVVDTGNTGLQTYIDQFIDWKRTKGFEVHEVTTTEAGSTANNIRAYIQNAYTTWENPPEYIILIGDVNGTYPIPTFYESTYNGSSDHMYACLDDNDLLPEAFVGRISISSQNDFLNYLAKINLYERSVYMSDPSFYLHSLLVGDTSPSGESCVITSIYIRELIEANDPDCYFTDLYTSSPSPSAMDVALNAGSLFFNYRGWIGMSGWGSSNIANLTNTNKLTNAVIITCGTGDFAGTATTEEFTRAGTPSAPKGAMFAIGMSSVHTHTQYNNMLDGAIFHGIFNDRMNTMGEALMRGKLALYNSYCNVNYYDVYLFTYWCNLMGDPSCDVWRTIPRELTYSYNTTIPLGQDWLDVDVIGANNQPMENAWVTARMGDDVIYDSNYTDEDGHVTLHFDGSTAGEVDLTITHPDYLPHLGSFTIESTGGMDYADLNIDDSAGNGNNEANPGENLNLYVLLQNCDSQAYNGISAVLSTEDEYLTITGNTQSFGTISAGQSCENSQPFTATVSPDAPDRHEIECLLTISDTAGNTWIDRFWMTVHGNDIDIAALEINDGGNGALDPGETSQMLLTLTNNGEVALTDVWAELSTNSGMIEIGDSLAWFGNISIGDSVTCSTNAFEISGLTQLITGMKVNFTVRLFNEDGYEEIERFELPIGITTLTDPIGPDEYGYLCYDDGDTGYADAPTYSWLEIDPFQGGAGTSTGIVDNSDECDAIVYAELPFIFKFYGVTYTSITICSNGWISFGETGNKSFRNWPVPDAMGPSPIVAAFWEDLYTLYGGVYTYYDENMHWYIIEWSECTAYTSGINTFEIILYDPSVYPTSTGDGSIKIQYKTFNNTDGSNNAGGAQGNYCTVGLENQDGLVGLQYTYNNEYPTGAKPLTSEMALFFTSAPISYVNEYLTLGGYTLHDANGNGYVEAGENVSLGLWVNNIGEEDASNISAILRSYDGLVTVTDSLALFPDIGGGSGEIGLNYLTIQVSSECQNEYPLIFEVTLSSMNNTWMYPLIIYVYKPQLSLQNYLLNDIEGNGNGIADPNEVITLAIDVVNEGYSVAGNVSGVLTTTSSDITIITPSQTFGTLDIGQSLQKLYQVQIGPNAQTGTIVPLTLTLQGDNIEAVQCELSMCISVAQALMDEGFNTWLPDRWSIDQYSSNWSQSASSYAGGTSPEAMLGWTPEFIGVSHLIGPTLNLMGATDVSVSFRHSVNHFSGSGYTLALEIRANGGEWERIWSTPAGAQAATTVTVPVTSDLLNQPNFQFGWCFDGDSWDINYWYIDDIVLDATLGNSSMISGEFTLVDGTLQPDLALASIGSHNTHPDSLGMYTILVSSGEYESLSGSAPHYTSASYEDLILTFGQVLEDYDFELHWLAPADSLQMYINEDTHEMVLNWDYTPGFTTQRKHSQANRAVSAERQTFENFAVWRQFDTGPFVLSSNTTEQSWSEIIDPDHNYTYYITAVYAEGESDSTSHVCTADWNPGGSAGGHTQAYGDWLSANYPNPFNPTTHIRFSMSQPGRAELKVYNIRGQLVRTLVDSRLEAGVHEALWQGDDNTGRQVASGVYFYKLQTPRCTEVRKAILLK